MVCLFGKEEVRHRKVVPIHGQIAHVLLLPRIPAAGMQKSGTTTNPNGALVHNSGPRELPTTPARFSEAILNRTKSDEEYQYSIKKRITLAEIICYFDLYQVPLPRLSCSIIPR